MRLLLLNAGPIATMAAGDHTKPLVGADMGDRESLVSEAGLGIVIESGNITKIEDSISLESEFGSVNINGSLRVVDCASRALIPGFVDSHTHLLWDGDRANEMALRQSGLSYTEIANSGGGIMKTVDATRNADLNRLIELGRKRIARAVSFGTTSMECKSGYGLSLDSELRLLKAIGQLSEESLIDIHPTWLGAHDFPKGVKAEDYLEELINEQLPEVVEQGIARWADVFCEPGWYNLEQTEEVVTAAANSGLPSRLHVDEFVDGEGLALAAELGAVSGDHVGYSSDDARAAANEAKTMQTFLPGTPYVLGKDLDSPVKQCLTNEWRFSLATDFNPNCRSLSIPFLGSLATHRLGLSPIEALAAVTRNPATTLAQSEHEEISGSIRTGGRADILILDSEHVDGWCQMPGDNPVATTIANDTIVKS